MLVIVFLEANIRISFDLGAKYIIFEGKQTVVGTAWVLRDVGSSYLCHVRYSMARGLQGKV